MQSCCTCFRNSSYFAATFGLAGVQTEQNIYEANAEMLLQTINFLDDNYDVVHLVGHNPGVSNLLLKLTGEVITIPTSAWVEMNFEADSWAAITADCGTMQQYHFP